MAQPTPEKAMEALKAWVEEADQPCESHGIAKFRPIMVISSLNKIGNRAVPAERVELV